MTVGLKDLNLCSDSLFENEIYWQRRLPRNKTHSKALFCTDQNPYFLCVNWFPLCSLKTHKNQNASPEQAVNSFKETVLSKPLKKNADTILDKSDSARPFPEVCNTVILYKGRSKAQYRILTIRQFSLFQAIIHCFHAWVFCFLFTLWIIVFLGFVIFLNCCFMNSW